MARWKEGVHPLVYLGRGGRTGRSGWSGLEKFAVAGVSDAIAAREREREREREGERERERNCTGGWARVLRAGLALKASISPLILRTGTCLPFQLRKHKTRQSSQTHFSLSPLSLSLFLPFHISTVTSMQVPSEAISPTSSVQFVDSWASEIQ